MDRKQQDDHTLFFPSMESIDGHNERLKPLPQKKVTTLALVDDLSYTYAENLPQKKVTTLALVDDLSYAHTENLHSGFHLGDQDQKDNLPSDCESGISGTEKEQEFQLPNNGLVRMPEGDKIYEIINKKLGSTLSSCGFNAQVETIHRNAYSGVMNRARNLSFGIYARAMENKCDGNANVKYAWYGASKYEIDNIVSYGFGLPASTGVYGHGIYLSPADHPVESMQSSVADDDGLRHILLCRVILGRMEVIRPGSGQFNPSSEEFDSGVDNLVSPKKYIIWSASMNTRILPEFVVSFRTSSYCTGCHRVSQPPRQPNSDWIPFAKLINALSKFLPPDAVNLIAKHHSDHKKQKITRHEMIQKVRRIAGDKLLIAVIKSYRIRSKNLGTSSQAACCN